MDVADTVYKTVCFSHESDFWIGFPLRSFQFTSVKPVVNLVMLVGMLHLLFYVNP